MFSSENPFLYRADFGFYRRVGWWLEKSRDPNHQRAYDTIVNGIPVDENQTILEAGCGSGEVLKRLYGKARKVVGVDIDRRMLHEAQRNLTESGIEVVLFDNPGAVDWFTELDDERTVTLIRDDITATTLPERYFDHVLTVLTELSNPLLMKGMRIDEFLFRRYKETDDDAYRLRYDINHAMIQDYVFEMLRNARDNLKRLLRVGGIYSDANYINEEEHQEYLSGIMSVPKDSIIDLEFIEAPEIYSESDIKPIPELRHGYSIVSFRP